MHLDEATPHLHIDFVPFTTGSKRGLDTRVSLKQALANQGFVGNGREETEWALWVNSEKESLAESMLNFNIEWENQHTSREHLSVLDYKKKERQKEVIQLEEKVDMLKMKLNVIKIAIMNCRKLMKVVLMTNSFYLNPSRLCRQMRIRN